ncbi:hypothetical protein ACFX13_023303 [Malus domestica]
MSISSPTFKLIRRSDGQDISEGLKEKEEIEQIKITEVQEGSFYKWQFKCDLKRNACLYKNHHSMKLQKSKRCPFRNRRGACFLKSWAAQKPRAGLRNRRGPCFSKRVSTCHMHTQLSADLRYRRGTCFSRRVSTYHMHTQLCGNHEQFVEAPISDIEYAPAFPDVSAPVTCTLSFAEITGNLSKISGKVESA